MLKPLAAILTELGGKLLQWREQGNLRYQVEGPSVKAEADGWAHDFLAEKLQALDSSIKVISEEDAASLITTRPKEYWLIDPIDGTSSYVKGFSGFVTQAALIHNQQPVLSCVVAPVLNTLFTAQKGQGAYANGVRLHVRVPSRLTTLVDNYPEPRGSALSLFNDLKFTYYKEVGSIGLKICCVADNTADLFFKDVTVRDWDVAAPHLILEEAGGVLRKLNGDVFSYNKDYSHQGLIATHSQESLDKVLAWADTFYSLIENRNENFSSRSTPG